MNEEAWLAERRKGVTGSDISILLGVNKYKSPKKLLEEKLGLAPGFTGNEYTRAGQLLEPYVADHYSRRTKTLITNGEFVSHPDNPRFMATTDYLFVDGVLEIKTGSEMTFYKGLPKSYLHQVRWYMYVTGRKLGVLSGLICPKDRTEIPQNNLEEWVRQQPIRDYEIELGDPSDMIEVASAFLVRLDEAKSRLLFA